MYYLYLHDLLRLLHNTIPWTPQAGRSTSVLAQPGFAAQDVLHLAVEGEGVVVVVVVVLCGGLGLVASILHVDIGMAFRMFSFCPSWSYPWRLLCEVVVG